MTREQRELVKRLLDERARARVAALRRQGFYDELGPVRYCACGCGAVLPIDGRPTMLYLSKTCRNRAHERRRAAA